jgi:Domain of unknown function (DUF4386)
MKRTESTESPQPYARACGVMYLYIIASGIFAELFVRSQLIRPSDAAATASNILANETLFRIGFSGEILHISFDVAVAVILYFLLRPVNRNIALLAAFMRLACDIILATASISHFAALRLLSNADYLSAFTSDQLQAAALFALRLHNDAYAISLVFFGFACLALGYLIFWSRFLPRWLGALMALAGISYLLNNFALFLDPALGATLFSFLFAPMFIAELALALWLAIKGVNVGKWRESAGQTAEGSGN